MKVLHVVTDLGVGGAEMMLLRLVARLQAQGHQGQEIDNRVVVLADRGVLAERIERAGVPVEALDLQIGRIPGLRALRLPQIVRRWRPDVLQGWMYHGNLAATFAAALSGLQVPVAWGIHFSPPADGKIKPMTRALIRLGARLSSRAAAIAYCSTASAALHEELGYRAARTRIIENGIDSEQFKPDPAAGPSLRKEIGIADDVILVGLLARHAAMKDHPNLFAAIRLLRAQGRPVHLLLAGTGITPANDALVAAIRSAGIGDAVTLLGERHDTPRILAGLDLHALSSSHGEAFPLILCEAMACGVPCVATDLGDCDLILGETGEIVPPSDPASLAISIGRIIDAGPELRAAAGAAARARIVERFDLAATARGYAELYLDLARPVPRRRAGIGPTSREPDASAASAEAADRAEEGVG